MKLFLDSCNIHHINEYKFLISGVTTNASMGMNIHKILNILDVLNDNQELHVQVHAQDYEDLINIAKKLSDISKNIVIKIPISIHGLKACKHIKNIELCKVNMTLCFTPGQVYTSYLAGADYISLFIGRMIDHNIDCYNFISKLRGYHSHILAASIRNMIIFDNTIGCGINNFTIPYNVMQSIHNHYLTEDGYNQMNGYFVDLF